MAAWLGHAPERLRGRSLGEALAGWGPALEALVRRVLDTAAPELDVALPALRQEDGAARCFACCYPLRASSGYIAGVDLVIGAEGVRVSPQGAQQSRLVEQEPPGLSVAGRAAEDHERAGLFEAEHRARERAERLQAVTTALSRAITPIEVYDAVVRYGVGALEAGDEGRALVARTSSLYLVAGDALELVGWGGYEPVLIEQYRRVPLAAPVPNCEAARYGRAVWLSSKEDYARRYPHLSQQIQLLLTEAAVSLPVEFEHQVLGVLTFTFVQPHVFSVDEQRFLLALADQAAQAIERSRLFASLRESEERFRSVFESIDEGFCIIELSFDDEGRAVDYRFLQANRAFERMTESEHIVGRTMRDLWPDLEPFWLETYGRVAVTGEAARFESSSRVVGRWFDVYASRLGDASSRRVGVVFNNITERKQAEQALIRRSAQLQRLAEAAVRINAARDVAAVLELVTEEARALIGAHQAITSVTTGASLGQSIRAVSLSERYARWRDYHAVPDGSGIYAVVCRTNRPLRLTQAELEAHPGWNGFGAETAVHPPLRGWLAAPLVGRDGRNLGLIQLSDKDEGEFSADDQAIVVQLAQLTSVALEQQQLYEEEQRARAAAEAAVRLREEFLSIASHELRTPLTLVVAHAQSFQRRAQREGTLDERDRRSLQQILIHAGRLNRMIEAMLDVGRIDQGRLQIECATLDLAALVREAVVGLNGTSPLHQIVLAGDEAPLWVSGDALRLEQVLHNLLGNALKYSLGGGTIAVSLAADADEVRVTVRDEGIGIPADDLPHLFERFYRAGNVSADTMTGVGIGLFIVREIVALHGGTMSVESEEGRGSSFTFALPRAAAP